MIEDIWPKLVTPVGRKIVEAIHPIVLNELQREDVPLDEGSAYIQIMRVVEMQVANHVASWLNAIHTALREERRSGK